MFVFTDKRLINIDVMKSCCGICGRRHMSITSVPHKYIKSFSVYTAGCWEHCNPAGTKVDVECPGASHAMKISFSSDSYIWPVQKYLNATALHGEYKLEDDEEFVSSDSGDEGGGCVLQ
eukprot:TRINITY_DN42807_c0_g1_i1.p2 TRINITY_DN42807_c0_g1~~TRINITY_DN42807_c0_g1_i1.p2  ORF type:complete len:119 (+),score=22.49 TRINITY_DN42807_c0_g1_i1:352-708(+)